MQKPFRQAFYAENLGRTLLLLLAAGAALLFFGRVIADALGVFSLACLICFLISPLTRLLERKLPRSAAALLSLLAAGAALLLLLLLVLPLVLRELAQLAQQLPAAFARLGSLLNALTERLTHILPGAALPAPDLSAVEGGVGKLAKNAIGYVGGFAGALYRAALSVMLSYFLLVDRDKLFLRLELMLPSAWRCGAVRFGKALLRELRLYLRGQATISLSVGALSAVALSIVGVRGGVLLGLIVGIFNMIPYFGPVIGGAPALLLALSDGWQRAAFTVAALFLVQQIDGMVISPRVMGNITGFSPGVVLIALFIGSGVGGIWGMLLAMPALMTFRTLYRVFVQRYDKH